MTISKLPLIMGVIAAVIGFAMVPYFEFSLMGFVSVSHPSYYGFAITGFGVVLATSALIWGINAKIPPQWYLSSVIPGLVLSISGFLLSVSLWLVKG